MNLTILENGMVPVRSTDSGEKVVNARELHEFLESKRQFSNWIQDKIEKYGFIEGEDFLTILLESHGGRPKNEYILKLDVAKEIAMVENNFQGRKVRRYFIEVEKKHRNNVNANIPKTLPEALRAYAEALEDKQALEQQAIKDKPKVLFADAVSTSNTSILIGELAKILKQNGIENMGQNRLFEWMRENGYLIKREGTDRNMPTQYSMERELFRVKETVINHSDGHITISKTPKITGKGQAYFVQKFLQR